MSWKPTLPLSLLLGLMVVGLLTGLSAGFPGGNPPRDEVPPELAAYVSWSEEVLFIQATGPVGSPGYLQGFIIFTGSGQGSPIPFSMPIVFDGNGSFQLVVPLHGFDAVDSFDCAFHVTCGDDNGDGSEHSQAWGVRMLRRSATDPNAPPAPSGSFQMIAIPGTTAPLWPLTIATISAPSLGVGGQDHLTFYCSVTGIEGVLPVH